MDYLLLLLLILIICIPILLFMKFDLLSPTTITIITYCFSILLAFCGLNTWNNQTNLHFMIYIIIIFGLIMFGIGEFLSNFNIKHPKRKNENYNINSIIKISNFKYLLSLIVYIITIFMLINDLKNICISFSYPATNLTDLVSFYRNNSSLFSSNSVSFGFITLQLIKVCNVLSVIYIFIIINNLVRKDRLRNNMKYFICVALCVFISFLQSGRGAILKFIVSSIIIYGLILGKNSTSVNKDNKNSKLIKKIFLALIIVLPLFYFVAPLFGRNVHSSFFDYISSYFGCPIPSFNYHFNFLNDIRTDFFGEHIFYNFYYTLDKLNIIDFVGTRSLRFINVGSMWSNVYTGFYRSYIDFGLYITLLLSLITGYVYGLLYRLAKNKKNIKYLIFYALYSAYIVDMFRDETLFSTVLSLSTVLHIILIHILVNYFLSKYKISEVNFNDKKRGDIDA